MNNSRLCVGCSQHFTPTRRGGFLCQPCIDEIRREAEKLAAQPLRRWELSRSKEDKADDA